MNKFIMALALALLTACDYGEKRDIRNEHSSSGYLSAMADYQAGRLDAAVKGFAEVVRKEPDNASARFQYACLLQDYAKNYQEAYCAFREYLQQRPKSEKNAMAHERCDYCCREMAKELAKRFNLSESATYLNEIAALKKELSDVKNREATLKSELDTLRSRAQALSDDRNRMLSMIKGEGEENADRPNVKELKDLLDEDDTVATARPSAAEVKSVLADDDLNAARGTAVDLSKLKGKGKPNVKPQIEADNGPLHEQRPERYVVQEGDTLMRLAMRFYGQASAWRRIREANKAVISNDGRIRKGTVLRLP